jgi:hypothetical protein
VKGIRLHWRGETVECRLSERGEWSGPHDLVPILNEHFGVSEDLPTPREQAQAAAERFAGVVIDDKAPASDAAQTETE